MLTTIKKAAVTSIAVLAVALPAHAERNAEPAFLAEVDSCVAELVNRIDVTDVSRVRHIVTDYRKSALGYTLKIQTSVFTPNAEAKYSVYCVANGNNAPLKFRWKALNV